MKEVVHQKWNARKGGRSTCFYGSAPRTSAFYPYSSAQFPWFSWFLSTGHCNHLRWFVCLLGNHFTSSDLWCGLGGVKWLLCWKYTNNEWCGVLNEIKKARGNELAKLCVENRCRSFLRSDFDIAHFRNIAWRLLSVIHWDLDSGFRISDLCYVFHLKMKVRITKGSHSIC